jgi:hypothetical protein
VSLEPKQERTALEFSSAVLFYLGGWFEADEVTLYEQKMMLINVQQGWQCFLPGGYPSCQDE